MNRSEGRGEEDDEERGNESEVMLNECLPNTSKHFFNTTERALLFPKKMPVESVRFVRR